MNTFKDIVLREACKLLNRGEIIIVEIKNSQEIIDKRYPIFNQT